MLIHHDPDEWTTVSTSHTCPYHEANPGKAYAGCTCGGSIGQVRRPPAEVAEIKARKRLEHEERVLNEAEAIKRRRAG